jgi:predicted AAA+ superfamily ATPase
MFIKREIGGAVKRIASKIPVISICGPRQSGKTTLAKHLFPAYRYLNFEDPEIRYFARNDPKSFLNTYKPPVILDEIQYVPELFSYLQLWTDDSGRNGEFILTGSQNFLMMNKISQSLAGRVAIFNLLPLSVKELSVAKLLPGNAADTMLKGFYPRLFSSELLPREWYPSYINTYLRRDVRDILNVTDLHMFEIFLKVCAGRAGQILNQNSIAGEIGVSNKTIQRWISVLEASYIIFLLQPYYRNYNKRILKSPKLFFYDTGLLCTLMGIKNPRDLQLHYNLGNIFENLIISELVKTRHNGQLNIDLYYWRESNGAEIDCIADYGSGMKAIEIKSAQTIHPDLFRQLTYWDKLTKSRAQSSSFLVYRGEEDQKRDFVTLLPWYKAHKAVE